MLTSEQHFHAFCPASWVRCPYLTGSIPSSVVANSSRRSMYTRLAIRASSNEGTGLSSVNCASAMLHSLLYSPCTGTVTYIDLSRDISEQFLQ